MFWPEMISRWQRPGFLGGVLGQEPDFVVGSSFHGLWLLRDHMSYRLGCVYIYIYHYNFITYVSFNFGHCIFL